MNFAQQLGYAAAQLEKEAGLGSAMSAMAKGVAKKVPALARLGANAAKSTLSSGAALGRAAAKGIARNVPDWERFGYEEASHYLPAAARTMDAMPARTLIRSVVKSPLGSRARDIVAHTPVSVADLVGPAARMADSSGRKTVSRMPSAWLQKSLGKLPDLHEAMSNAAQQYRYLSRNIGLHAQPALNRELTQEEANLLEIMVRRSVQGKDPTGFNPVRRMAKEMTPPGAIPRKALTSYEADEMLDARNMQEAYDHFLKVKNTRGAYRLPAGTTAEVQRLFKHIMGTWQRTGRTPELRF